MRIVVNHLTRLRLGDICVAGLEEQTGKHIRPVCGLLKPRLLKKQGGFLEMACLVDLGRVKSVGKKPHIEDWEFKPQRAKLISQVEGPKFRELLEAAATDSVRELFGDGMHPVGRGGAWGTEPGHGDASLGCLRVSAGMRLYLKPRQERAHNADSHCLPAGRRRVRSRRNRHPPLRRRPPDAEHTTAARRCEADFGRRRDSQRGPDRTRVASSPGLPAIPRSACGWNNIHLPRQTVLAVDVTDARGGAFPPRGSNPLTAGFRTHRTNSEVSRWRMRARRSGQAAAAATCCSRNRDASIVSQTAERIASPIGNRQSGSRKGWACELPFSKTARVSQFLAGGADAAGV